MVWKVPLSDLDYGAEEYRAAHEVLENGWLSMGETTERFEGAFAEYIGVKHAIAVSNATAALHLANLVLGIGAGDEVIVPSLTFVATASAPAHTGATPIFADITSEDDLSVSAESIAAKITSRTKAIIVMHYGGYFCDMTAILGVARERGIAVIEDAAHAPGSELNGKKAGSWGDIGCFSFFANKNLVTGEGGMIVTNRDDLADRIRLLRSHGMTSLTWDRHTGHAHSYDVIALGFNYRIDEIRSMLGLTQLKKLEANNTKRRSLVKRYQSRLSDLQGIGFPYKSHRGVSAAHLFPVLLAPNIDRTRFIEAMHAQGVQTSIHYPPVHQFSHFRQLANPPRLPVTEQVASLEVTLPLYPTMDSERLELVVTAASRALERVAA